MTFYCPDTRAHWSRCFALVDMASFFAAVEQLDHPALRARPVVVTNGSRGSTIITSSYHARAYGIHTGMKLTEAQRLCPSLVRCPSRPERYTAVSTAIMQALGNITPDYQVYSVDECFLDLGGVLDYYGSVSRIAQMIWNTVFQTSNLHCSVGICSGPLTAKWAASLQKPGISIICPDQIRQRIASAPIESVCGIGPNIARYLHHFGVHKCGEITKLPMDTLAGKFGDLGRRLYLVCQGEDPYALHTRQPAQDKSMGHSKILPPATTDRAMIRAILRHLSDRLASRLRAHDLGCRYFSCSITTDLGKIRIKPAALRPVNDSHTLWQLAREVLTQWQQEPAYQISFQARHLEPLQPRQLELDLFTEQPDHPRQGNQLDAVKDRINQKFGRNTVVSGLTLMNHNANMIPVISPAWQPQGVKKSL